jgi:hypothetical protein
VEQTAAVGRNDKGGTSPGGGNPGPKSAPRWMASPLGDRPDSSSSEQRSRWEWTPGAEADGGANFDNPKRGVLLPRNQPVDGRKAENRKERREKGQRREDSVFVEEAKVMRAGPLVDPTPRRA